MPAHKLVDAPNAPQAPGPFSHGTVVGPWVYISGMGGLDPKTGQVICDDRDWTTDLQVEQDGELQ